MSAGIVPPRPVRRGRRWLFRLLAVAIGLLVVGFALEVFLRLRFPFADIRWPAVFEPRVGFRFDPGGTVAHTNLWDFAVTQPVNAMGFLDREHEVAAPPGRRRIVVLGDSFVEAAQVAPAQKFTALLEERLRADGGDWEVVALGMSGCGTANEIAFYEEFGRPFRPEAVIAVFVGNDFANNSALLEGVRNGWHPVHTPRLFFTRDEDGGFRRIGLDPSWWDRRLHTSAPRPPGLLTGVLGWSRLYRWTSATLDHHNSSLVAAAAADHELRCRLIEALPGMTGGFGDWLPTRDLYLDWMFAAQDLPPAFAEAVALTEHAIGELRRICTADGARFLMVAGHEVGRLPPSAKGATLLPGGQIDRLGPICQRQEVPLLDLRAEFTAMGVLDQVEWSRDSHWNPQGHRAAAEAIHRWLRPMLAASPPSQPR